VAAEVVTPFFINLLILSGILEFRIFACFLPAKQNIIVIFA
jgi:hypothetical protein